MRIIIIGSPPTELRAHPPLSLQALGGADGSIIKHILLALLTMPNAISYFSYYKLREPASLGWAPATSPVSLFPRLASQPMKHIRSRPRQKTDSNQCPPPGELWG